MRGSASEGKHTMKLNMLVLAALIGATAYVLILRRQLQSAQMRGDMYHAISTRLDRRIADLTLTTK